jgi:hypothetical protein
MWFAYGLASKTTARFKFKTNNIVITTDQHAGATDTI